VTHSRDFAERVDGVDLRRVREDRLQFVWHLLFAAGDAASPDEIALRRSDDLQGRHDLSFR